MKLKSVFRDRENEKKELKSILVVNFDFFYFEKKRIIAIRLISLYYDQSLHCFSIECFSCQVFPPDGSIT